MIRYEMMTQVQLEIKELKLRANQDNSSNLTIKA